MKKNQEKTLRKLNYHIKEMASETGLIPGTWISDLNYEKFNDNIANRAKLYIDSLSVIIRKKNKIITDRCDSAYYGPKTMGEEEFQKLYDQITMKIWQIL